LNADLIPGIFFVLAKKTKKKTPTTSDTSQDLFRSENESPRTDK